MKTKHLLFAYVFLLSAFVASAQPSLTITPDHDDWKYKLGESVTFTVSLSPAVDTDLAYEVGYEKMKPHIKKNIKTEGGKATITTEGMHVPGFLMIKASFRHDGKTVGDFLQVGFEPEKITASTQVPDDFAAFWEKAKTDNARLPLNLRMEPAPEHSTEKVACFHIRYDNVKPGTHMYGYLLVPRAEGRYPALINLPGAGVGRMGPTQKGMAEKGAVTLQLNIHGIPLNLADTLYNDLKYGPLDGYQYANLDMRERYYYYRVILGCLKAVDVIFSLPQFDGQNLLVSGGSQGGALTIMTTALDRRVKNYAVFHPAMCDHAAYLDGRAGGWPHFFSDNGTSPRTPERIRNAAYYDAVNFARLITVPGMYSWGYNDMTCPVTSIYAAYNSVAAPKDVFLDLPAGHARTTEQNTRINAWITEKLFPRQK